jgi:hypothetical protein
MHAICEKNHTFLKVRIDIQLDCHFHWRGNISATKVCHVLFNLRNRIHDIFLVVVNYFIVICIKNFLLRTIVDD